MLTANVLRPNSHNVSVSNADTSSSPRLTLDFIILHLSTLCVCVCGCVCVYCLPCTSPKWVLHYMLVMDEVSSTHTVNRFACLKKAMCECNSLRSSVIPVRFGVTEIPYEYDLQLNVLLSKSPPLVCTGWFWHA